MKSKKINIPFACTEKLEGMEPTKNGCYCHLCQQELIDFREKSDAEIIAFFKNYAAKKICAITQESQLGRPLDNSGSVRNMWSSLLTAAFMGLGLFNGSSRLEAKDMYFASNDDRRNIDTIPANIGINGIVRYRHGGYTASGCTVELYHERIKIATVKTDASGKFYFDASLSSTKRRRLKIVVTASSRSWSPYKTTRMISSGHHRPVRLKIKNRKTKEGRVGYIRFIEADVEI